MTKHDLFVNLTDVDVTYSGEPFKIRAARVELPTTRAHYLAQNVSHL